MSHVQDEDVLAFQRMDDQYDWGLKEPASEGGRYKDKFGLSLARWRWLRRGTFFLSRRR